MAEKEERIYLFTDKMICENCKDWYEHIDPLDSPDCAECAPADFPYITLQEAIERMAKEMARLYCPEKPTKKEFESIWKYELLLSTQKHFKELAQAALNSLLEGK